MQRKTHLLVGLFIGLLLYSYCRDGILLSIVLVSSILSDLDWYLDKIIFPRGSLIKSAWNRVFKRGMHRTLLHNVWVMIAVSIIMEYFNISFLYMVGFNLGFISHLILDSLTKAGIYLLWPVGDPHVFGSSHLYFKGPVKTGGAFDKSFQVLLLSLNILIIFSNLEFYRESFSKLLKTSIKSFL